MNTAIIEAKPAVDTVRSNLVRFLDKSEFTMLAPITVQLVCNASEDSFLRSLSAKPLQARLLRNRLEHRTSNRARVLSSHGGIRGKQTEQCMAHQHATW